MRTMIKLAILVLALPLTAQTLDSGLGTFHWRVSTKNAKAQAFFDQGMKYVYAFNHEKAVSSFEQAAKLDPDLGLAYWGAALALGPNINLDVDPDREKQAYETVHKAQAHLGTASEKERALIFALGNRYSNDPKADLKKLAVSYSEAMGSLAKKYPTDDNIATLYAESLMDLHPWKLWTHDGQPVEGTKEIVQTLERVLKRNPNHIGANHYYIHAIEGSPHPELAKPSAARFADMAPSAGHLVHMPAHIYQRTGNYLGAAQANERAAQVDREFIKRNGPNGIYPMMYYTHNLQFGAASYAMIGRYDDAMRMARGVVKNVEPMLKEMPPIELGLAYPVTIMVRFGKWRDILREKPLDAGPVSSVMSHYARGSALAALGDTAGAESELKDLEEARKNLTDDPGMMQNPSKSIGEIASPLLRGRVAAARGDHDAAIDALRKAVDAEDAMSYDEPPDWWLPARETLGAELLRAGRAAEAEQVFRDDLKHNAKNPRSLFGLAQALKAQKKSNSDALAAYHSVWKGAPLGLNSF